MPTTTNTGMNQQPSTLASNYKSLAFLLALFILFGAVFIQRRFMTGENPQSNNRLLTMDELATFTKDELYLAILGHVFNVTSAPKFYSSTGSYRFYTGRDASRSFSTGGTSTEDLTDDLTGLNDESIAAIYDWLTFYQKQYPQIGKLVGRYFDSNGLPTKHYANVLVSVENTKKKQAEQAREQQKWPSCNSEWSQVAGKRVWCSDKSGGIERSWVGVPRRYFDTTTQTERCVCVQDVDLVHGQFKEYKDCLPTSVQCPVSE